MGELSGSIGPLEDANEAGMLAQWDDVALDANPYAAGTLQWWAWHIAYLREKEVREHEARPDVQLERRLAEQPGWERAEKLGAHQLAKRIHRRTDELVHWLGMSHVPPVLIDAYPRKLLREAVEQLLALGPQVTE